MAVIKVGNAPCSWGTLEFSEAQSHRLSYADVLDQLALTGYTGCELGDWGFMPTDPDPLHDEYRRRSLALTGAFVPVALRDPSAHQAGMAQCIKVGSLLSAAAEMLAEESAPFLVLADENGTDPTRTRNAGRIQPSMGLSADDWSVFTSGADLIARAVLEETGLRTVFHHHCAGFVETHDEITRFLEGTDPAFVGLVFDTGHYAYGAGECDGVVAAMEDFRIAYLVRSLQGCPAASAGRRPAPRLGLLRRRTSRRVLRIG